MIDRIDRVGTQGLAVARAVAQQNAVESREVERRELVGALAAQEPGDVAAQELAPLLYRVGTRAVELEHFNIGGENVGEKR